MQEPPCARACGGRSRCTTGLSEARCPWRLEVIQEDGRFGAFIFPRRNLAVFSSRAPAPKIQIPVKTQEKVSSSLDWHRPGFFQPPLAGCSWSCEVPCFVSFVSSIDRNGRNHAVVPSTPIPNRSPAAVLQGSAPGCTTGTGRILPKQEIQQSGAGPWGFSWSSFGGYLSFAVQRAHRLAGAVGMRNAGKPEGL